MRSPWPPAPATAATGKRPMHPFDHRRPVLHAGNPGQEVNVIGRHRVVQQPDHREPPHPLPQASHILPAADVGAQPELPSVTAVSHVDATVGDLGSGHPHSVRRPTTWQAAPPREGRPLPQEVGRRFDRGKPSGRWARRRKRRTLLQAVALREVGPAGLEPATRRL